MKEKDPLVSSVDYGRDGTTAKVSIIIRHDITLRICTYVRMYIYL